MPLERGSTGNESEHHNLAVGGMRGKWEDEQAHCGHSMEGAAQCCPSRCLNTELQSWLTKFIARPLVASEPALALRSGRGQVWARLAADSAARAGGFRRTAGVESRHSFACPASEVRTYLLRRARLNPAPRVLGVRVWRKQG